MTTTITRDFTPEEITTALEAMAQHNGSASKAIEQLQDEGLVDELTEARLTTWARRGHKDQYKQLRARYSEQNKETLADRHHTAAVDNLQLEAEANQQIREKIQRGAMDGKELAAVAGKAGINSGIHTEKGQLLSGEATARVERTPDEIARRLKDLGARISFDHEAEAEEIPEEPPALPETTD